MMDIDSAIKHCEEVAKQKEWDANVLDDMPLFGMNAEDERELESYYKCAEEHRQLAEWLKELKQTRQTIEDIKAEIKSLVTEGENDYQLGMNGAIMKCYQIINKHISGKEQE